MVSEPTEMNQNGRFIPKTTATLDVTLSALSHTDSKCSTNILKSIKNSSILTSHSVVTQNTVTVCSIERQISAQVYFIMEFF